MDNERIAITDILQTLPAQVYMRRGELVILFCSPADLVARVTETATLLSQLDRAVENTRLDSKAERSARRAAVRANAEALQIRPSSDPDICLEDEAKQNPTTLRENRANP